MGATVVDSVDYGTALPFLEDYVWKTILLIEFDSTFIRKLQRSSLRQTETYLHDDIVEAQHGGTMKCPHRV